MRTIVEKIIGAGRPAPVLLFLAAALFAAATAGWSAVWWFTDRPASPTMVSIKLDSGVVVRVARFEVSVADWNRCHTDGACTLRLKSKGRTADERTPAVGLNWFDVGEYLVWIAERTDQAFRLPNVEEWQAIAREVLPEPAPPRFTDPRLSWASAYAIDRPVSRRLRESGSFSTTTTGIADLDGNVWEWTGECYGGEAGNAGAGKCPAYWVAGEHMAVIPVFTRDPARGGCAVGVPPAHLGLRLVADIPAG